MTSTKKSVIELKTKGKIPENFFPVIFMRPSFKRKLVHNKTWMEPYFWQASKQNNIFFQKNIWKKMSHIFFWKNFLFWLFFILQISWVYGGGLVFSRVGSQQNCRGFDSNNLLSYLTIF